MNRDEREQLRECILIHTMEYGYENVYSLHSIKNGSISEERDTYIHLKEMIGGIIMGTVIYSPHSHLIDTEVIIGPNHPLISNKEIHSITLRFEPFFTKSRVAIQDTPWVSK